MPNVNAICIKQYPILKGILNKGDKVVIEPILYEEDTVICRRLSRFNSKTGKHEVIFPETIAKKGSYKGYRIKCKNKKYYPDGSILNAIGYVTLDKLFKKLPLTKTKKLCTK